MENMYLVSGSVQYDIPAKRTIKRAICTFIKLAATESTTEKRLLQLNQVHG